ncbi:sulfite exporter TauE/SafE family protein [Faecalicatena sp. Marseille-Q4148]|nr:sulfite exporter TauE/SafE family protein [Faecalicatena sp. Marseille-Q4148]
MQYLIIGAANFVVGGLIGMTGIAGFLLPILYAGYMNLAVSESLALSFFAFLISGIIGAWNYKKAGALDLSFAIPLSAGSFLGAVLGVYLNSMIPEQTVKMILYLVVLLSGISIFVRREKERAADSEKEIGTAVVGILGFVTGAICSMSGAGGPILVMPLLVAGGMAVRTAVGVSLFDSIFIAIPAGMGYFMQSDMAKLVFPLVIAGIAHAAGVYCGSLQAKRIPQQFLKKAIAVFSIGIAIWKLAG